MGEGHAQRRPGLQRIFALSAPDLDEFDRRIIAALTANARLTNLELAREISLSHSAISRRIRRLEEAGVLKG